MNQIFAILLGCTVAQQPDECHQMTVYGAQDQLNHISKSHTYATFAKIDGETIKESFCISWMPVTLVVKPLEDTPELGANISHWKTTELYKKEQITKYGPYKIKKSLYDMAKKQVEFLESGKIKYVCIDWTARRDGTGTNCAHAISDMDKKRRLITGTARGDLAARMVANHFRDYIIE